MKQQVVFTVLCLLFSCQLFAQKSSDCSQEMIQRSVNELRVEKLRIGTMLGLSCVTGGMLDGFGVLMFGIGETVPVISGLALVSHSYAEYGSSEGYKKNNKDLTTSLYFAQTFLGNALGTLVSDLTGPIVFASDYLVNGHEADDFVFFRGIKNAYPVTQRISRELSITRLTDETSSNCARYLKDYACVSNALNSKNEEIKTSYNGDRDTSSINKSGREVEQDPTSFNSTIGM